MKWAILLSGGYNIKAVEADDAEGAAKAYLREKNEDAPTSGPSKSGKIKARRPRVQTVSVIDVEAEKIREFSLVPPPPPPVEEWKVEEVTEDEDDEELDEDYGPDDER